MKFSLFWLVFLALASTTLACISGQGTVTSAISPETRAIAEAPTPTPLPIVSLSDFEDRASSVCQEAIGWWNSDLSLEGDIPSSKGEAVCISTLVADWCDGEKCRWPGPEGYVEGIHPSVGHLAASSVHAALASLTPIYPGDRFVEAVKEALNNFAP